MQLRGAILFVKDFPRMRESYKDMLQVGPVNTEWVDVWARFDLGGADFALHAIPEEYARGIQISSPPQAREQNPVKLVFLVKDVSSERARLEAMGAAMLQRPWQGENDACDGVDPEGNVFQLVSEANWH